MLRLVLILIFALLVICGIAYAVKYSYNLSDSTEIWTGQVHGLKGDIAQIRPLVTLSPHTEYIATFDDRWTATSTSPSTLYGASPMSSQEVWVIQGAVPSRFMYWSFTAFEFRNGLGEVVMEPIGPSFNNQDFQNSSIGDIIVVLMSPNVKAAEAVANRIFNDKYKDLTTMRVAFNLLKIVDFNPVKEYALRFEGITSLTSDIVATATNTKWTLEKYVLPEVNFIALTAKDLRIKPITLESSISEMNLGSFVACANAAISRGNLESNYSRLQLQNSHWPDVTTFASGVLTTANITTLQVLAIRHADVGAAIYSEVRFIDVTTQRIFAVQETSRKQLRISSFLEFVIISQQIPNDITQVQIVEAIYCDPITHNAPAANRLFAAAYSVSLVAPPPTSTPPVTVLPPSDGSVGSGN